jgi:AraC family transcriptional regulator of adaptative response / DNA-3-methyladenine glycosylase II
METVLDEKTCERARLARDPRFDGRFFTGVMTTGIFCRPICPARPPKPENVVYYPSAAAAAKAGLRPCLRCRPEAAPGTPAWNGTSAVVSRAISLIHDGALNERNVEDLAARVGMGSRHLRRLFKQHLGASPLNVANTHRVLFAKKLLNETDLSVTDIAMASGFGSIRQFNNMFKTFYSKPPSAFREKENRDLRLDMPLSRCELRLPYRPPFNWAAMLGFFKNRQISRVEAVTSERYCRTIQLGECLGWIAVSHLPSEHALLLKVRITHIDRLMSIVARVRRMFDLDANMDVIYAILSSDPLIKPLLDAHPGLRLPVAWDPFELAVRAILGQQISVKAASTIASRIADRFGVPVHPEKSTLPDRLFPPADVLANADLEKVGLTRKRAESVSMLAKRVADGALQLNACSHLGNFVASLIRLQGIGPWTAQYIAMRGLGEPDAFPDTDLGVKKALEYGFPKGGNISKQTILKRADAWRPWRAYVTMYLWHSRH